MLRTNAWAVTTAVILWGTVTSPIHGGPHLGMKLACQAFGHAWSAGDRTELRRTSGGALAHELERISDDELVRLVHGSRVESSQVVGSTKSSGSGSVDVRTDLGSMRFILAGHGWRWFVVDVQTTDENGRWSSLSDRLAATSTARDFYANFRDPGTDLEHLPMTEEFRRSLQSVPLEERAHAQSTFASADRGVQMTCVMVGNLATVSATRADGNSATFFLRRGDAGWVVDDLSIRARCLHTTSLKTSFSSYAAVVTLGKALKSPGSTRSLEFVHNDRLRELLAERGTWTEQPGNGSRFGDHAHRLEISDDARTVICRHPDHQFEIDLVFDADQQRMRIAEVTLSDERGRVSLAQLLLWEQGLGDLAEAAEDLLQFPRLFPAPSSPAP